MDFKDKEQYAKILDGKAVSTRIKTAPQDLTGLHTLQTLRSSAVSTDQCTVQLTYIPIFL